GRTILASVSAVVPGGSRGEGTHRRARPRNRRAGKERLGVNGQEDIPAAGDDEAGGEPGGLPPAEGVAVPASTADALPLSGVRVIDVGNFLAGPYAASIMGEFGAEVLKVEHPIAGDPMR